MENQTRKNITIIGAGPVGLMCAIYAIKNNIKPIIISLDERNQKTAGIAAGGMLAPAYECFEEANDDLTIFALNSRKEWDIIAKTLGVDIAPFALALGDDDELVRLEKIKSRAQSFGLEFNFIKPFDFLNCKYALSLSSDGLLNPIIAMNRMRKFCIESGAIFINDEIFDIEKSKIYGKKQEYESELTIIANGFSAKSFMKKIAVTNKLNAVRGQVIEIDHMPNFEGSMRYNSTYLMARGDKIMVGATSQINDEDWQIREIDQEVLFKSACQLMPQLIDKKISNSFAGLRPLIKGEAPIIGESEIEGVFVAIGAYRNGWAYAPLIGKILIENIALGRNIPLYLGGN